MRADIRSTTIRHTDYAISANGYFDNPVDHTIVLRDVVFEEVAGAWSGLCLDEADGIVVRDAYDAAIETGDVRCAVSRAYRNVTIERTFEAIRLHRDGEVLVESVTLRDVTNDGIYAQSPVARLEVRDSLFERVSVDWSDGAIYVFSTCGTLFAYGNTFRDNSSALLLEGCNEARAPWQRAEIARNVFEENVIAFRDITRSNAAIDIHLNAFVGDYTMIELASPENDVDAQGNYFGDPFNVSTPSGALAVSAPKTLPNLPCILDYFDNNGNNRVARADNPLVERPLTVEDLPIAYIREPMRTRPYNATGLGCVPIVADAPGARLEVLQPGEEPTVGASQPDASCRFFLLDDKDPPDGSRTGLAFDDAGCLDVPATPIKEGTHALVLKCIDYFDDPDDQSPEPIPLRVDRRAMEFLVDNSALSGELWRPVTT